jgi:hypothetical protein
VDVEFREQLLTVTLELPAICEHRLRTSSPPLRAAKPLLEAEPMARRSTNSFYGSISTG